MPWAKYKSFRFQYASQNDFHDYELSDYDYLHYLLSRDLQHHIIIISIPGSLLVFMGNYGKWELKPKRIDFIVYFAQK